ncbi:hypothetical protein [Bacillus cereus group sp. N21]|uniref:hypothetical protein n=1 Tax=Bacillus cereus group sp. N21 TaxID=2794591 RepID=UPI0018F4675C|nr:hypothetical protein [Bacillus cereus group sp. N21]MBJ8030289.1 hypothetical protein [Bacillus cereus group sp. N21]
MLATLDKIDSLDPEYKHGDLQNKLSEVTGLVHDSLSKTKYGLSTKTVKSIHEGRKPMTDATEMVDKIYKDFK